MKNEIMPKQTFPERLSERIKKDIGELITNEELSEIIKKVLDKTFFEERTIKEGWQTTTAPPEVNDIVKELLKDTVTELVQEYIKENKNEIQEIIKEQIQKGIGASLIHAVTVYFRDEVYAFESNLTQKINNDFGSNRLG